jgi:hypothetical protein
VVVLLGREDCLLLFEWKVVCLHSSERLGGVWQMVLVHLVVSLHHLLLSAC